MSSVKEYKKAEAQFVKVAQRLFRTIGSVISRFFTEIINCGKQHFTVMIIPHVEKHTAHSFRVSLFSLVVIIFLFICMTMSFIIFTTQFTGLSKLLAYKTQLLEEQDEELEQLRDQIAEVRNISKTFENSLSGTMIKLGLESQDVSGTEHLSLNSESGMEELLGISLLMENSIGHFGNIDKLLRAHENLIQEMPTRWPLKDGGGRFTSYFGPTVHPFTKNWYLHKGIDLAAARGTPLVATANGKVIEKGFEPNGYGNYIVIKHKYGFYTKYAHMDKVYVKEGKSVLQGDVIGTMGNTGLSTGSHLHYEVRIGTQVVDPQRYLNLHGNSGL